MRVAVMGEKFALVFVALISLAFSGISPHDRLTWVMETAPVMIGVPLLITTHARYPLTPLVYRLLFLHGLILMLGGYYTYARVPLGFWVQDAFDLARNHYDRLGHLAQGFVPAMVAREILLRQTVLRAGGWLFFLVTCIVLALSASYELIEWWSALIWGGDADAFLATQGDVWDTQWDMFMALLGGLAAQAILARSHDRQMRTLVWDQSPS